MLGKVIAYGPDREAARRSLVAALDDTAILGLTTNAGFLRALAAQRRVPRRRPSTPRGSTAPRSRRRTPRPPGSSAAWTQAWLDTSGRVRPVAVRRLPDGCRSGPASTSTSMGRSSSTELVGRSRSTGRRTRSAWSRPSTTSCSSSSTVPRTAPSSTCRRTRRGGAPRPAVRVRAARRDVAVTARRCGRRDAAVADAGHRPRRPGRRGRRGRGGPGAGRDRGDEDGAQPQGAVRRHRHRRWAPRPADQVALGDTLFVVEPS